MRGCIVVRIVWFYSLGLVLLNVWYRLIISLESVSKFCQIIETLTLHYPPILCYTCLRISVQLMYRLFFMRLIAQFFTEISMNSFVSSYVEQTLEILVNLWTISEYHVKLWLIWKIFTTIL